jgi:Tfp pilus assembly protein PilV
MRQPKQSGFAVLEVILVLVVVAVLGFTVYNFVSNRAEAPQATSANVPSAPAVNKASDLTTAKKTLDQINVDEAAIDSADIDAELSAF